MIKVAPHESYPQHRHHLYTFLLTLPGIVTSVLMDLIVEYAWDPWRNIIWNGRGFFWMVRNGEANSYVLMELPRLKLPWGEEPVRPSRSFVAIGDYVYVAGDAVPGQTTLRQNSLDRYHIPSKTWEVSFSCSREWNFSSLLLGGNSKYDSLFVNENQVCKEFHPATKKWSIFHIPIAMPQGGLILRCGTQQYVLTKGVNSALYRIRSEDNLWSMVFDVKGRIPPELEIVHSIFINSNSVLVFAQLEVENRLFMFELLLSQQKFTKLDWEFPELHGNDYQISWDSFYRTLTIVELTSNDSTMDIWLYNCSIQATKLFKQKHVLWSISHCLQVPLPKS